MRFLYSLILNIINDNVDGIYRKYRTDGLYAGLINSMYAEVREGITKLLDDIPGNFIGKITRQIKENLDKKMLDVS